MNSKKSSNSYLKIYFYTTNKSKFEFARRILNELNIELIMVRKYLREIMGKNLLEIVRYKLKQVSKLPAVVEDSGLFIKSLKGFPGVITAYVLKTIGFEGLKKLISNNCPACYISIVGYKDKDTEKYFIGKVRGIIKTNFNDIDSAFHPYGFNKSYKEMNFNEMRKYSDWGISFGKLKDFLSKKYKLI